MKATEQTLQQVERALRKVAGKFPSTEEANILTDIHIRVNPESGELTIFDDDDQEITRCVVEQWIDNKEDSFYQDASTTLRTAINDLRTSIEQMSILKPFSLVLENEDHENVEELYLVDDDIVIIDQELMSGLDEELDDFLKNLLSD